MRHATSIRHSERRVWDHHPSLAEQRREKRKYVLKMFWLVLVGVAITAGSYYFGVRP